MTRNIFPSELWMLNKLYKHQIPAFIHWLFETKYDKERVKFNRIFETCIIHQNCGEGYAQKYFLAYHLEHLRKSIFYDKRIEEWDKKICTKMMLPKLQKIKESKN